jgi:Na+-transporting NADH:ubiquinone oxidoreductase subunit B
MPLKKYFLKQKVMIRVSISLIPLVFFSVYLFGWRVFFITLAVFVFGIATEALFTVKEGKPVTSAVLVTCLIYSLSLASYRSFLDSCARDNRGRNIR